MKTAIVTGGSGGIGQSIVKELACDGFTVFFTYLKNESAALHLEKEEKNKGNNVISHRCDIRDFSQCKTLVYNIISDFGRIDLLVNNAGISLSKLFTDTSLREWKDIINTHINGCYNMTENVLPHMLSRKQGSVINISSMWGETGASMEVAYSTAKAGIIGFTKALAKETAPSGIRVNAICPGVISTDMLKDYTDDAIKDLEAQTPLKRLGTPEDIAFSVSFLASKKADFITGQIIGVNGGFHI